MGNMSFGGTPSVPRVGGGDPMTGHEEQIKVVCSPRRRG